jgi:LPXTG-motif cell wall-anchored protein
MNTVALTTTKWYSLPQGYFAATYNCGVYGSSTYDQSGVCGSTVTGSASESASGGLANTGVHVVLPILIGVVLIAIAIYSFRKGRK